MVKQLVALGIVAMLFASPASGQGLQKPATAASSKANTESRYLAFQIFTYGPDPRIASMGEGPNPLARFPDKATLRDYIQDIKRRIGAVGDRRNRLAVVLGHLSFDHGDADVSRFIALAFRLALETDVAVGFHIDDSMFWARRKDMSFRVVTKGDEALRAYRKFLTGKPLIEVKIEALTLLERLPPKIHRIQKELPAWVQKTGNQEKATSLLRKLDEQMKAKTFEEAEKIADCILKLMGVSE